MLATCEITTTIIKHLESPKIEATHFETTQRSVTKPCGLCTVKKQLYLRRLVSGTSPPAQISTVTANTTDTSIDNKLTMSAMRAMSEEDRRLYLIKLASYYQYN